MIDSTDNRRLLGELARDYQVQLTEHQASLLLTHLDLLVERNKTMNLTRIVEPLDAIVRHTVDSLLLIPSITKYCDEKFSFVDVGTGGGFPGLPLAIVLEGNGLLIDSVGKKVRAVVEFINALGLSSLVQAETTRAEDLAKSHPHKYDLVTARAVAELPVLIEYASPLLKKNGYLTISKANISEEEVSRGDKVASLVGMEMVSRETYELPYEMGHREILSFRKSFAERVKLPRQVGMAKHHPLA